MSRSPVRTEKKTLRQTTRGDLTTKILCGLRCLTAVVFEGLVFNHGESIAAGHQVGRHHQPVDLLVLHWLVLGDAAVDAQDAQALHATSRRFGQVELYMKTCGGNGRWTRSVPDKRRLVSEQMFGLGYRRLGGTLPCSVRNVSLSVRRPSSAWSLSAAPGRRFLRRARRRSGPPW